MTRRRKGDAATMRVARQAREQARRDRLAAEQVLRRIATLAELDTACNCIVCCRLRQAAANLNQGV
jgi:hypothetical protein